MSDNVGSFLIMINRAKKENIFKYLGVILIFSIASIAIQSAQMYERGFILGVDSIFHMNRIYETMMQMQSGEFNYFLSLFSFQQSARIVNAFYGPAMAYLLGAILLFTESWVKFQLVTSFLVNIIGAIGIYRIAKKLSLRDSIALMSGILYMSSYFVSSWNLAGSFTSVGNMLIPFVIYYGIEMLINEDHDFSAFGLGLSMGMLLQTHVFSSLLATITLAPFIVYSFYKCDNKKKFAIKLLLAIILAILLSLNVWTGMLHLMSSNELLQTFPSDLMANAVYFLPNAGTGHANIGIIFSLVFFIQICYSVTFWNTININNKLMTAIGVIFLFISSRFFPWNVLGQKVSALETLLQFPSRLIIIPTILLLLSLGMNINKHKEKQLIIMLGVITLFSVSIAQNRVYERMDSWKSENVLASPNKKPDSISSEDMRNAIKSKNLEEVLNIVRKGTSDYLPLQHKIPNNEFEDFNPYTKYWTYIIYPNSDFNKEVKNGKIIVTWNNDKEEKTNIPIVKYNDTIIEDVLNKNEIKPELTEIGTIQVEANQGQNRLEVSYDTPSYVIFSIFISSIVFIISLCYICFSKIYKLLN